MASNSMEESYSSSSKFKYEVVLDVLADGQYRLVRYNSPYKSSEQELDDINAMLTLPGYSIVDLSKCPQGRYSMHAECIYIPNSDRSTYDQVFRLIRLERI